MPGGDREAQKIAKKYGYENPAKGQEMMKEQAAVPSKNMLEVHKNRPAGPGKPKKKKC